MLFISYYYVFNHAFSISSFCFTFLFHFIFFLYYSLQGELFFQVQNEWWDLLLIILHFAQLHAN